MIFTTFSKVSYPGGRLQLLRKSLGNISVIDKPLGASLTDTRGQIAGTATRFSVCPDDDSSPLEQVMDFSPTL